MRELNKFKEIESLTNKLDRLESSVDSVQDPLKKESITKLISSIKAQIAQKQNESMSFGNEDHRRIGGGEDLMFL